MHYLFSRGVAFSVLNIKQLQLDNDSKKNNLFRKKAVLIATADKESATDRKAVEK